MPKNKLLKMVLLFFLAFMLFLLAHRLIWWLFGLDGFPPACYKNKITGEVTIEPSYKAPWFSLIYDYDPTGTCFNQLK